jgi:hypothetical protein
MNTEGFTQLTNTAKRTVAVTLNLTIQEADLYRKAGEALYGKGHPVTLVIRELANWASQRILKNPPPRR